MAPMNRASYNILRRLLTQYLSNPQSISTEEDQQLCGLIGDFHKIKDAERTKHLLGLSKVEIIECMNDCSRALFLMALGGNKLLYDWINWGIYWVWVTFVFWLGFWSLGWMK